MLQNLSPKVVDATIAASEEASAFGSDKVLAEHLLIGLLRIEKSEALGLPPVNVDQIREVVSSITGMRYRNECSIASPVEFDEIAQSCLKLAHEVMKASSASSIQPQHLLAALASDKCSKSREALQRVGIDPDQFAASGYKLDAGDERAEESKLTSDVLRQKLDAWAGRAEMARAQGRLDLVESALRYKADCEQQLQRLLEEPGSEE